MCRARRMPYHQFRGDFIFFAVWVAGAAQFVQNIGGHASKQITMDINGRDGGIAIFREPGPIESRYGNILGNLATHGGQALHHAHGSQIIDSHHRRGPR